MFSLNNKRFFRIAAIVLAVLEYLFLFYTWVSFEFTAFSSTDDSFGPGGVLIALAAGTALYLTFYGGASNLLLAFSLGFETENGSEKAGALRKKLAVAGIITAAAGKLLPWTLIRTSGHFGDASSGLEYAALILFAGCSAARAVLQIVVYAKGATLVPSWRKAVKILYAALSGMWVLLTCLLVVSSALKGSLSFSRPGFTDTFFLFAGNAVSTLLFFFAFLCAERGRRARIAVSAVIAAAVGKILFYLAAFFVLFIDSERKYPVPAQWLEWSVPGVWGVCSAVCLILLIAAAVHNKKTRAVDPPPEREKL